MDLPETVLLKLECYDVCFFKVVQRRYEWLYNKDETTFGWYITVEGTYFGEIAFGNTIALAIRHTLIGWLSTASCKGDNIAEVIVSEYVSRPAVATGLLRCLPAKLDPSDGTWYPNAKLSK